MSNKKKYKLNYNYAGVKAEQADFFAIEIWQDGFGADTWIVTIYPTLYMAEANINRIKNKYDCQIVYIVGGKYGEEIEEMF